MKICDVCNKPYEYALKVSYVGEGKVCTHDKPWIGKYTLGYIKRQREEYAVDMLQPMQKGVLQKDYVRVYGAQKWMTNKMLREMETA